ncbi:hypothetical protein ABC855_g3951 [[Candida] zeylanoides]
MNGYDSVTPHYGAEYPSPLSQDVHADQPFATPIYLDQSTYDPSYVPQSMVYPANVQAAISQAAIAISPRSQQQPQQQPQQPPHASQYQDLALQQPSSFKLDVDVDHQLPESQLQQNQFNHFMSQAPPAQQPFQRQSQYFAGGRTQASPQSSGQYVYMPQGMELSHVPHEPANSPVGAESYGNVGGSGQLTATQYGSISSYGSSSYGTPGLGNGTAPTAAATAGASAPSATYARPDLSYQQTQQHDAVVYHTNPIDSLSQSSPSMPTRPPMSSMGTMLGHYDTNNFHYSSMLGDMSAERINTGQSDTLENTFRVSPSKAIRNERSGSAAASFKNPRLSLVEKLQQKSHKMGGLEWNLKKGNFKCSHCTLNFTNLMEFAQHLDENDVRRPHLCPVEDCPWSVVGLPRKVDLRRHCMSQHFLRGKLNEDDPLMSTETKSQMVRLLYSCDEPRCGKHFYRRDSLQRHQRLVHFNENSSFNRKWNMKGKTEH